MRKTTCGVYRITSPSGKFYIGSSVDVKKRWAEHRFHMARGSHHNAPLNAAAKKYGVDAMVFDLLEECDRDVVRQAEQRFIDDLKPRYNLATKVEKLLTELWARPEFRAANSARCAAQNRAAWADPEYRAKFSGRHVAMLTEEARAKSRAGRRAYFESEAWLGEGIEKVRARWAELQSRPGFREATVARQRVAMKKMRADPRHQETMLWAIRKANCKPIRLVQTGEVYPSVGDAAKSLGVSIAVIGKQINGLPTRTGYQWEFVEKTNGK